MARGYFRRLSSAMPGVDAVEADSTHAFSKHTHETFGIGLVLRGAQKSRSGRGMVEAGPGDIITVNPSEVHDGMPIGTQGRAWRMLYFEPGIVAGLIADITETKTTDAEFSQPVFQAKLIAERFHAVYSAVTRPEINTALGTEETALALMATTLSAKPPALGTPPFAGVIRNLRQRIDDDPTAAITLADLSAQAGLSRFQIMRGFARQTGLTPHAYLVQRRMDLARQLMTKGMPLAMVAATAGFADQSHMTRLFVQKYGLSPRTFVQDSGPPFRFS